MRGTVNVGRSIRPKTNRTHHTVTYFVLLEWSYVMVGK